MKCHKGRLGLQSLAILFLASDITFAQQQKRQIDEIVITAERRESTVAETSISISAFNASMISRLGMQSAEDLINLVPATTMDQYGIRIRGMGLNFNADGGDPGVATYYNGVYSEDFFIAFSENAWFDLERVEVLRGPQGTLYGRNAIGGAVNFISNKPTMDWEVTLRTQLSNYEGRQYFGAVSGPLIKDKLAARLVLTELAQGSYQEGLGGTEDLGEYDDDNIALSFLFNIRNNLQANLRINDREREAVLLQDLLLNQGSSAQRDQSYAAIYSLGLTPDYGFDNPITEHTPGALAFIDPRDGAVLYGAVVRPGLDSNLWPNHPNPTYGDSYSRVNSNYAAQGNSNNRNFSRAEHQALTFDLSWRINETTQLKYIGGYSEFKLQRDYDADLSNGKLSNIRSLGNARHDTLSHELQLFWGYHDVLAVTSGLYYFNSQHDFEGGLANDLAQGRYTRAVDYGNVEPFITWLGGHSNSDEIDMYSFVIGRWEGKPGGNVYQQKSRVDTTQVAAYTQAVYQLDEEWALTLGARWARDEKDALELRDSYTEIALGEGGPLDYMLPFMGYDFYDQSGFTPLGALNVMMGNADYDQGSGLLNPVCHLDDPQCLKPLRLGGVPISNATKTKGDDEWSKVTWRANMDWTPNENTLVYLSATTGYRAGGYSMGVDGARDFVRDENGVPIDGFSVIGEPFSYDEETVIAYELGYKAAFMNRSLQIFSSLYWYDYENYQDVVFVYDSVRQAGVKVVENAPSARNRGVEIEFTWLLGSRVSIGGSYSYTESEYDEDYFVVEFDDPAIPPSIFGSLAQEENRSLYVRNVKGDQLKGIPTHKAALWGSYAWQTEMGQIWLTGVASYLGEYASGSIDRKLDEVPSRTRLDTSLNWTSSDGAWYVRLFVNNVFDEIDAIVISSAGEGGNWIRTAAWTTPRRYGVDISWNF
ncbi:MAG: TonB-dependent receptor [Halieaceae bacterium]|jgi:iron complex outermembrane recepter protein|nr:TonB-dependent receptor [Halieaceae bacterium]